MKPYLYSYQLPPGMSYAEAGRLKLQRIDKRNPLCCLNGLRFRRQIFARPTVAELGGGLLRRVNLLDPQQTLLPQFDMAHLNNILGSCI